MSLEEKLPPIHPGEILKEEFLIPMNVSQYRLAKTIGVDTTRINAIVHGKRAITAETALLLARFFGNSPSFWMGLQSQYDLEVAEDRLTESHPVVNEVDRLAYAILCGAAERASLPISEGLAEATRLVGLHKEHQSDLPAARLRAYEVLIDHIEPSLRVSAAAAPKAAARAKTLEEAAEQFRDRLESKATPQRCGQS